MSKKRLSKKTLGKRKKIGIAIAITLVLCVAVAAAYFVVNSKDPLIGTWSDENCTLVVNSDGTFDLRIAAIDTTGTWENLEAETKEGAEAKVQMYRLVTTDDGNMVCSGFLSNNGEFTLLVNVKGKTAAIKFTKEK